MSLHSFEPDIAAKVGVGAAVIYQNFLFWCRKNSANRRHIRDGYVWTYNSRRALAELFPYLTESQIRTAISKLVESGLLVVGNYNAMSVDKTSWYAPAVSAEWIDAIGEKSPMDWSKMPSGLAKDDQPIPVIKPDVKPDGKQVLDAGASSEKSSPKGGASSRDCDEVLSALSQSCSTEAAKSFIAYRRKSKGKGLTLTAAIRQAKQLKLVSEAGMDPDDALGMAEERGWQSMQADWYFKVKNDQSRSQAELTPKPPVRYFDFSHYGVAPK